MLAFLSDVLYWQSIEHPMYNALKEHLSEFNEYFVENFHSLIQCYTAGKIFNIETLMQLIWIAINIIQILWIHL
jgi:hypothetical protein